MKISVTGTEISKTHRTRDGRAVRIYATDHWGHHPIIGAILNNDDWVYATWMKDGLDSPDYTGSDDLMPIPKEPLKVSFNIEAMSNSYDMRNNDEIEMHFRGFVGKRVLLTVEEIL